MYSRPYKRPVRRDNYLSDVPRRTLEAPKIVGALLASIALTAGVIAQLGPSGEGASHEPGDALGPPQEAVRLPGVGINLAAPRYWIRGFQFNNIAHAAGDWLSQPTDLSRWNDHRIVSIGVHGYPQALSSGQAAVAPLTTHNGRCYPPGRYVLTWQGKGDVRLVDVGIQLVRDGDSRRVYAVAAPSDIGLRVVIFATDPSDPVREIRVIPPGGSLDGRVLHPDYARLLGRMGVVRMMDWGSTNNSDASRWEERAAVADFSWGTPRGVPWAAQIAAANEIGADLWICVPHQATDDYVLRLAELVGESLRQDLRVWVEYSNEVWNGQFEQHHWVAKHLVRNGEAPPRAYGRRAVEVFRAFEKALPDARVVNVVAGQTGNPWILDQALDAAFGCGGEPEVAAVTAYFGSLQTEELASLRHAHGGAHGPAFALLRSGVSSDLSSLWQKNAEIASSHGVPLVAYEGGQHLAATNVKQRNDGAFIAWLEKLNEQQAMREVYQHLRETWKSAGGRSIVYYNDLGAWDKFGCWGHLRSAYDLEQPKWMAVNDDLATSDGRPL